MNRVTAKLLFFVVLLLSFSKSVFAYDLNATGTANISAQVISQEFNPPTLVSPADNSSIKNTREPLVWKRPSPLPYTPLHHYDLYLDGQIFAASVSDGITTQEYYFYTIHRDGDTFYLYLNTDLTQGYHTWSVTAYDNYGTHSASETRTFYIDSIDPFIKLEKVDRKTLNWNTANPSSIPDINLRGLSVSTPDPLLTGTVEPYANMQIVLICPQNIRDCHDQTWTGNYPTGLWQHRFYGLTKGLIYTVYLSATDASGNSTIFPMFYLAYGVKTPIPTATVAPTVSPTVTPEITPEISPTLIPTPTIPTPTPTVFIPVPPVSPTPPAVNGTLIKEAVDYFPFLLILLVLGLPLHLLMTGFGAHIYLRNLLQFIYVLFLPFIGKKRLQTLPFTTIEMYDPEKISESRQIIITDVNGFYDISNNTPSKIFIKLTSTGRLWQNTILESSLLPRICLYPLIETPLSGSDRLRKQSMTLRSLPLIIACLTSAFCLITRANYFYLVYLYLSLNLVFSEYVYPHITKD